MLRITPLAALLLLSLIAGCARRPEHHRPVPDRDRGAPHEAAVRQRAQEQELQQQREAKRKADYAQSLTAAREALAAGNHDRALAAISTALDLAPQDKEALSLRAEVEFHLRVHQGNTALKAARYEEAIKSFVAARQLRPEDQGVQRFLQQAQQARQQQLQAELEQAIATGCEHLKSANYQAALQSFDRVLRLAPGHKKAQSFRREAEFHVHCEAGRKALQTQQPEVAIAALEKAIQLRPQDQTTLDLLQRAREARQKQIKMAYDRTMEVGRAALAAERFEEAIQSFRQAQTFMPRDKEALRLVRDAEARQQQRDYNRALNSARSALTGRKYDDAIRSLQEAQRLKPKDPEVVRLLKTAESHKRDYDRHLSEAQAALSTRRYDDAIKSCRKASAIMPSAAEPAKVLADAETRKRDYDRLLQEGRSALSSGRYDAALTALCEAERILPAGRSEAPGLRTTAEAKKRKADYDKFLGAGKSALDSRRYDDAMRFLQEAQRLLPAEPEAGKLLAHARAKRQEYDRHLVNARAALSARRYDDAIRAGQEARQVMPSATDSGKIIADAESKKRDYDRFLTQGKLALSSGRYDAAIKSLGDAERLSPAGQSDATRLRTEAETKKRAQAGIRTRGS